MGATATRSRPRYVLLLGITIGLGLASRLYRGSIPLVLDRYAGDTLWATAVLLLLAIVFSNARTSTLALAAGTISLLVELSQLAHPPWLDALRRVPGVALVIGYDFVWIDLLCYAMGVFLGTVVDAVAFRGIRREFSGRTVMIVLGVAAAGTLIAVTQLPAIGAGGLLHPMRRSVIAPTPDGCADARIAGEGIALAAWRCAAIGERRGTVVYLHGIADNRSSAAGAIARFRPRGFDVIAYDSRAHGESDGEMCTYGFFEKRDLARVLPTAAAGPIVLIGASLGAAVALQESADNPAVSAVVAAEAFSDLQTVARERAPFFFTDSIIMKAFRIAEARANFRVDAVSPRDAARNIRVPVLLVHGEADRETPPEHSRRIFEALAGPKELVIVPGAGHNQSLNGDVWTRIERWIDAHLSP